jgi:predicted GNAT family N-acyltransferase
MKTCYTIQLAAFKIAIADLSPPEELTPGWTINRINVPEFGDWRGKGHGSRLLKMICDDADKENQPLYLEPMPSGPLDYDALVAWYKRYGFVEWKYGYLRRPKQSSA